MFYHGSDHHYSPIGTILLQSLSSYLPLEHYRPTGMLSHREAVFMCDSDEDLDAAGGGTEWVFTVKPLGPVQKHDMNWGSEISMLLEEYDISDSQIEEAALNYWHGVPSVDPLWEYLTPSALILNVEEF